MCPSHLEPDAKKGMMSKELFCNLVDQAAEWLPVALVPFFRGEPLMHPEAPELLYYAKQKGLGPIQLANNGSLMDPKTAARLLDAGVDFISFSLDTMEPDEYLAMRRGEPLAKVVENIMGLLELRDQGNYPTQIQVSATRTDINHKSIDKFIAYWRNIADRTRIYYEHSKDGHLGSLDCPEVPDSMSRKPCQKLYTDMVVYWNGQAAFCNHDWQRGSGLGDLNQKTIREIWLGERYEKMRSAHDKPEAITDSTCLYCDHWKISYLEEQLIGELYTPSNNLARANGR
jgi:radical SAM protein with 4Fe4S-binding SPASM domain